MGYFPDYFRTGNFVFNDLHYADVPAFSTYSNITLDLNCIIPYKSHIHMLPFYQIKEWSIFIETDRFEGI